MDKISKGFVGRTVRAVLFIILIIVFCTAISSAGIYLASRYGLTQSREQVPLTALYLGNEGKVELPGRGKMVEGKGLSWDYTGKNSHHFRRDTGLP